MPDYQSQAIILKVTRLNEADKILHLYSPSHGPIRAVAKSAFKLKSKTTAKTQVLNHCDFLLASGRNLDIVREVKLIESFSNINSNYEALCLACFVIDILDHIAVNDDHYQEPFTLLIDYLHNLNSVAQTNLIIQLSCKYLWQLIDILGYKPELNTCSLSHTTRTPQQIPQYFDFENGSITSTQAYREHLSHHSIQALQPGVFNILESLDQSHIIIDSPEQAISNTLKFLHKHLEYRVHKEFKSWKLVEPIIDDSSRLALAA